VAALVAELARVVENYGLAIEVRDIRSLVAYTTRRLAKRLELGFSLPVVFVGGFGAAFYFHMVVPAAIVAVTATLLLLTIPLLALIITAITVFGILVAYVSGVATFATDCAVFLLTTMAIANAITILLVIMSTTWVRVNAPTASSPSTCHM
jgi:hypothetical protein